MAFEVNPEGYQDKGGPRRPDVRAGEKLLWLAGLQFGKSQAGNVKIDACFVVVGDNDGGTDVGGLVWTNFTLTQTAAWKLQQVSVALQQRGSWNAEDPKEAWEVLSKRPVIADISVQPKHSGDGTRPNIERFKVFGGDISEGMEATVNAAEQWYTEWKAKKAQGGGGRATGGGYGGGGYGGGRGGGYGGHDDGIPF